MILTLLIGLALTAAAVTLGARAVLMARLRAAATLDQITRYGFGGAADGLETSGLRRVVDELAGAIGNLLAERLRLVHEEALRKLLVSAGMYRSSARTLVGYQALGGTLVPVAWLALAVGGHVKPVLAVLGVAVGLVLGWKAPLFVVRDRAARRLARIDYDMPELIDLLVVMVEAGLGLTAALQSSATRLSGPLGEELRITTHEQRMGLSTLQALEAMLGRCSTPAVRAFVRTMVQGERLGVSVAQILRSLALEMRKRRRAVAEERAQKAPIKILFPLVFMIFPALFVVILGPAVVTVFQSFGG
jgi:tight adherence protein C